MEQQEIQIVDVQGFANYVIGGGVCRQELLLDPTAFETSAVWTYDDNMIFKDITIAQFIL